jgi:hypothetical protein
MRRRECLGALAPRIGDQLIATRVGPGGLGWGEKILHEGILYGPALGFTTALALGIAVGLPQRRAISIDTDGGILMGLGVLATIGALNPPNLTVLIFDNGAYGSTGGQPSATSRGVSLAEMARGAGIRNVREVFDVPAFLEAFDSADTANGATLILAKVDVETKATESQGKILGDGRENMYRFVRYVERTEGRLILRMLRPGRFERDLATQLSFGGKREV